MNSLATHILQHWQRLNKVKIFVAASGGLDSTVLAFLLKNLNFDVEVLHVNYQLRGDDSDSDAGFIENFCGENEIVFHKKTINLSEQLQSGGNLQELARIVRYDWFNTFLAENDASVLALAHHKNDQIETFFLNLSRKSGVMGLAGMLENNERYIRPLLPFSKSEIRKYAIKNGLTWRDDSSNASNKYRRNFLRNAILPILNHHLPKLEESVLVLIEQFQKKQTELEAIVHPLIVAIHKQGMIATTRFLSLNELEQVEFLRQLKQKANMREALVQLASIENGKRLNLSKNPFWFESIVKKDDAFYFIRSENEGIHYELILERAESLPQLFSKNEAYFDETKLHGELRLRKWQKGDRIKPIGMKGSKLVSDVIKDAKLSPLQKQEVLVVTDDKDVHWCVGLLVGRLAIANTKSTKMIKCYTSAPVPIVAE